MREENVTKNILQWLKNTGWTILCYDFPQSGTGVLLHRNRTNRTEKNKGGIIPDIIAIKDEMAVFFENKDRFYEPDFNKLYEVKNHLEYSDSLDQLLAGKNIKVIYYGVAISELEKEIEKCKFHLNKIDFLISTSNQGLITIHYDLYLIFANAY